MYVVIGANGYMGAYVIKNLLESTKETILAVTHRSWKHASDTARVKWAVCDVADPMAVENLNREFLSKENSNKVVYLAAYHHPDQVEKNPKIAWDINITSLSRFMNAAEHVTRFFYPSTDSVYGESVNGYHFRETDALHPVNRYGRQKCVAETLVTAYGYNVVRFPFLIAPSLVPEKPHFYDTIAGAISNGKPFEMFADSYRSSLDFDTAASLMIQLMELEDQPVPPVVNVCGDADLSKYDVGLMVADRLGVSRDLIVPISINANSDIFAVQRASSTLMDNTLLKQTLHLSKVQIKI